MYAENLKKIRKELDLSVAKMADRMKMSQSTLTGYERGDRIPSAPFFTRLYKTFNINLNWYASGEGEMFNAPQFNAVKDELRQEVLQILKDEGIIK